VLAVGKILIADSGDGALTKETLAFGILLLTTNTQGLREDTVRTYLDEIRG
jgi:hypothetical protein